jgi:hypothetical protein
MIIIRSATWINAISLYPYVYNSFLSYSNDFYWTWYWGPTQKVSAKLILIYISERVYYILEVSGLNLGQVTEHLRGFHDFLQSLQANFGAMFNFSMTTSFHILFILSFDTIYYEILAALLNKNNIQIYLYQSNITIFTGHSDQTS